MKTFFKRKNIANSYFINVFLLIIIQYYYFINNYYLIIIFLYLSMVSKVKPKL